MIFSVCALCRDNKSAENILNQIASLFPKDTDLLILENSQNEWDSYSAIRYFIKRAQGEMIVLVHDDIEFQNLSVSQLLQSINKITCSDPTAIIFGVAGISNRKLMWMGHLFNLNGEQSWGFCEEGKASSLDECFLVINRKSRISVSEGLTGFHFYGTDLCLNAMKSGHSCYVIDYPITHKSAGNINENFFEARDRFEEYLKHQGFNRYIRTTCTVFYSGTNLIKECWALALSYVLIETPRHRDFDMASLCILKRGRKRYGRLLFYLMILLAKFELTYKTYSNGVKWWSGKWKQHLASRLSWSCK
jgi:hypothetical protein